MKKLVFTLLGISLLAGVYSCSEDFEVSAPYKNITFVYGFLNAKDTAHYVRVQKAFLDENKSAIDMAKVADSSFYNQLDVKIKEINAANFVVGTPIQLTRVDLAQEGYPKDSGAFFNTPSYAYKFKKTLNASYKYRLVITNMATGNVDSSEITIIDPNLFTANELITNLYKLKFANTTPVSQYKYQVIVTLPTNVQYLESFIRFHWIDKDLASGAKTRHSADFLVESRPRGAVSQQPLQTPNTRFYSFLSNVMGSAAPGFGRYLDSCDIYIYGGGVEYYNYTLVKLIQSGLTSSQSKPVFTNIRGKDAYGLFTSRTEIVRLEVPIDSVTLDSLMVNPVTVDLNIKGFSDE